jgi:hypothetical protein
MRQSTALAFDDPALAKPSATDPDAAADDQAPPLKPNGGS